MCASIRCSFRLPIRAPPTTTWGGLGCSTKIGFYCSITATWGVIIAPGALGKTPLTYSTWTKFTVILWAFTLIPTLARSRFRIGVCFPRGPFRPQSRIIYKATNSPPLFDSNLGSVNSSQAMLTFAISVYAIILPPSAGVISFLAMIISLFYLQARLANSSNFTGGCLSIFYIVWIRFIVC